MGLRFRKSISLIPGVKLNFGKSGMSVSTGVPGFRKTFHSSGRVTTSVGIPGTGISYVTTKNRNKPSRSERMPQPTPTYYEPNTEPMYETVDIESIEPEEPIVNTTSARPVNREVILDIHKVSDEMIDWTEVLVSPTPTNESYNNELWSYCHSVANDILSGDIDTYLKVIQDLNPLEDLLQYGGNFEFGTDDASKIEVEFDVNSSSINLGKTSTEYQDYVCSVVIRVARDMMALLPVQNVVVHACDDNETIISICFDRATMETIRFNFADPSDSLSNFRCNMNYTDNNEFIKVERLDI